MVSPVTKAPNSAIREALARVAYAQDAVRIAERDLSGCDWLVATHRGILAVGPDRVVLAIYGWFFGICRYDNHLLAFENSGHRDSGAEMGRIIQVELTGRKLGAARVLIDGLHNNCHQINIVDGLLCVVDTANQAIRRFTVDGLAVDVRRPFPVAPPTDTSGAYLHINTIAKVGDLIGLMLHNGKAIPTRHSEVAWLDMEWNVRERRPIPGHHCHDIVEDEAGRLWHSLSLEGEVLRSDGMRVRVTDTMMTRGIALGGGLLAIGTSTFGPRHLRGTLNGGLAILDSRNLVTLHHIPLPGAPTDVISI